MNHQSLSNDQLLREREAASIMGYSTRTLRRMRQRGEIASYGKGKLLRYSIADIREWQKRNRNDGGLN